jgi:hypothetical protein
MNIFKLGNDWLFHMSKSNLYLCLSLATESLSKNSLLTWFEYFFEVALLPIHGKVL